MIRRCVKSSDGIMLFSSGEYTYSNDHNSAVYEIACRALPASYLKW